MSIKNNYSYSRQDSIKINTPIETMIRSIWDLDCWEEKLEHIKNIEILYDDGYNQEFLMGVKTENNSNIVNVRSIRRKNDDNSIEFFQPEPPEYLLHHAGLWSFSPINKDSVEVFLEHNWNLDNDTVKKLYPNLNFSSIEEKIENDLFDHAQASLNLWKTILEKE
ncbi:hypothetical protein P3U69_12520 (plasmid) [Staphylococcus haemolyticus]|uniref:hypothetical protein n=1 Tax=Staphylococcus haemolyticus TaxID=1283 RepID=UPI0015D6F6B1|nr:hypothetical protein [Staphylococcus haemolyticus]WQL37088.1 hypothetical protein P3U69_12520 [Staphylococcus haemolyticus]